MNENTDKLEIFRAELEKISSDEAEKLLSTAKKQAESGLSELKERLGETSREKVKKAAEEAEISEKKRVSEVRFSENRRVLLHRAAIMDEFFGEIERKVVEKLGSEEYRRYLERCLNEAEEYRHIDGETTVFCRAEDAAAVKQLVPDASVEPYGDIRRGGIMLRYGGQSAFVDFTLDTVLAQERESFSLRTELQI